MATPNAVPGQAVPELATKQAFDNAIADPRTYTDENRYHAIFSQLRRDAPIYWTQPQGYRPFWTVSRHADICAIELNSAKFLNDPRLMLFSEKDEAMIKAFTGGSHHLTRNLVSMDNPDHKLFRAMTAAWFGAKNINKLEDDIRALARESVDRMVALGGACDFVEDIALWYPLRVIMHILGMPRADEAYLMTFTQEIFGPQDPDAQRGDGAEGLIEALADFGAYCDRITADRRVHPRDDVATVIANARMADGAPIGNLEAMSYYVIVATAGHDTTSSSSAAGLLQLIRNPEQLALLKASPELMPRAVDEFIRWSSPVKHFFRTAAEDTEVGGQAIRAGDALMMCYPSANRDEAAIEEPFAFRVDRSPAKHIAFGYGPHLCLGQHLAKLEVRILFEELIARIDDIELAGEPRFTASSFVSGLKSLPIRYRVKS